MTIGDSYYNEFVYVSRFWENGPLAGQTNVVMFKDDNGRLKYDNWIPLGKVTPSDGGRPFYPQLQAINPWNGFLYTCKGGLNTKEFYANDPQNGKWMGEDTTLRFSGGEKKAKILKFPGFVDVDLPSEVQGACFSPDGHVYIACDVRLADIPDCKAIAYFQPSTDT